MTPQIRCTDKHPGGQMTGWALYGELEDLSARAFGGTTGGGYPLIINLISLSLHSGSFVHNGTCQFPICKAKMHKPLLSTLLMVLIASDRPMAPAGSFGDPSQCLSQWKTHDREYQRSHDEVKCIGYHIWHREISSHDKEG